MLVRLLARVCALLVALAASSNCSPDVPAPPSPAQPTQPQGPATLTGVSLVNVPAIPMTIGQVIHLRARAHFSNSTVTDVTASADWTSSAPEIIAVSTSGVATALQAGDALISASYSGFAGTRPLRAAPTPHPDEAFRVVTLLGAAVAPAESDVMRVLAKANDLLRLRTGASMRQLDLVAVGPAGDTRGQAGGYMDSRTGELPDGIIVFTDDLQATTFGGYSFSFEMPPPFVNRYPSPRTDANVYVAAVHFEHKYGRCGYDSTGTIRIGDRSSGGECRNRNGIVCVDNGRYWQCPDTLEDLYADHTHFRACSIVHEFMHPFGGSGNNDHYGTPICQLRTGMPPQVASDHRIFQEHCGMCPDVFQQFRPR